MGVTFETDEDVVSARKIERAALNQHVRRLSTLRPWRSVAAIAAQWAVIAASMALATWLHHPAWYIVAAIVIASRQHGLGVLVHEATHYRLFGNRHVNDLVADVCCAFPIGIGTSAYRYYHFKHHQSVNTPGDPDRTPFVEDPDWTWPKTSAACLLVFARDVAGLNLRLMLFLVGRWSPLTARFNTPADGPTLTRAETLRVIAWFGALASVLLWVPGAFRAYILLWLVPQVTVLTAIFRIRALAEHYCVPTHDELTNTRTVKPRIVERLLIAPCNVGYHLEHHLFPSVPFYNLPRLHALLRERGDLRGACVADGYLLGSASVIRQMCGGTSAPRSESAGRSTAHACPPTGPAAIDRS